MADPPGPRSADSPAPSAANSRDLAGDERDRVAVRRDAAGDERDNVAQRRDGERDDRDLDADLRDEAGHQRDMAADERDRAAERSAGPAAVESTALRREASVDRWYAAADRRASGADRAEAGGDRRTAATNRGAGASERFDADHDRGRASDDREASAKERELSALDGLTGAYLRTAGLAELAREMARARRTHQPLVVAFVDVDSLKTLNDASGHAAGDQLLVDVVESLRSSLRPYDVVIRVGGDEFVCVIPGMDPSDAAARLAAANESIAGSGSVTVGLAEMSQGDTPEALVARADRDLYQKRLDQRPPPSLD